MTDIPDDVLTVARDVAARNYTLGTVEIAARAIMEERERCAQIADAEFKNFHNDAGRHLAGRVAAAIRKGKA